MSLAACRLARIAQFRGGKKLSARRVDSSRRIPTRPNRLAPPRQSRMLVESMLRVNNLAAEDHEMGGGGGGGGAGAQTALGFVKLLLGFCF